jgi:hypothetical protein
MSKHKGAEQRGKVAQQQGQPAQQNRDTRKPHEGGAPDRSSQPDRNSEDMPKQQGGGEHNR